MSSDWLRTTVEEIAANEPSGISIGPFGSRMKSECYVESGVPVVMGSNISDGKHPAGDFVFVTEAKAAELKFSEVREGDLIFPHRGAIGRVALIPPSTRMILSSSLMKLTPNQEKCCSDFLLYFFRSNRGVHELLKNASTVGTPGIGQPLSSLKRIPLEVPPLGEQKAIAHILGTLDDKIELSRKTNETLEAMAKALFKSWFVDFDPVRAKAEGRPTGLPGEISDLFPDSFEESELGEIPNGWEVAELGDCELDIESGRRPKGGIDKNLISGIPSIGAESIAPVGQFDFSKTKWVGNDFAESSGKGWIQNFDVALYKDGGKPGEFRPRTALYGDGFPFEKAMVNEHVFLLRSSQLGQPYLYYLFNFDLVLAQIIHKGSSKGAQPGLNQEEVRTSSFVKPDKRLLDIFNQTVEPGIRKQLLVGKGCQVLSELRDALLPKLISGEIRIPDAERMVEEVGI